MIVHGLIGMLSATWLLAQKSVPAVLRGARSGNVMSGHGATPAE
jgi:hypothetical protein